MLIKCLHTFLFELITLIRVCKCVSKYIYEFLLGTDTYRCSWSALDFSVDPPKYRSFVAVFDNSETFQEFKDTFYEGKELAEQSEILENPEGTAGQDH